MTDTIATQPLPTANTAAVTAPLGVGVASSTVPPLLPVSRKLSLPSGIASNVKQHVVVVVDTSSSMSGAKIDEANMACIAFDSELANPENKDGFLRSTVHFSSGAEIKEVASSAETPSPRAHASGGTNFDAALLKVIDAITDFASRPNPDGWHYLRPHVLFLSDGHSNVSDKNIAALHEIADVTAIAYGSDAARDTLARISTDGQTHVVGTSGTELRKFLAAVGKTLSQSLATAR